MSQISQLFIDEIRAIYVERCLEPRLIRELTPRPSKRTSSLEMILSKIEQPIVLK